MNRRDLLKSTLLLPSLAKGVISASERMVYYIDVGNCSPAESLRIVNEWRR